MWKEVGLMIVGVPLAIVVSLVTVFLLGGATWPAIVIGLVVGVVIAALVIHRGLWWMLGIGLMTPPAFFWGIAILDLPAKPTEPFYGPTLPWFLGMMVIGAGICLLEAACRPEPKEEH